MSALRKSPFLRFGLPFLSFMVCGTYALSYVTAGRYQLKDQVEKQKLLLLAEDRVTLPAATGVSATDMIADDDKDYEMVRVPRPSARK